MAVKALPSRTQWDNFDDLYVPEPNTGCYLWLGSISTTGYGQIHNPITDKLTGAHRVAFSRARGPIPAGLQVLHKCDMPSCVNPDHLFLGTNADNMQDKMRKGRHRPGITNKLTHDEVKAIRISSEQHVVLAARYGVSPMTIADARKRRTWRHLP